MKALYIFLIIFIALIICFVSVSLYFKYRSPYCGDELNKAKLLCGINDEKTCNPTNEVQYYHDVESFIMYLLSLFEAQIGHTLAGNNLVTDDPSPNITKGLFFYATPELLRIMPTDFGQNSLSPYGFASFFPIYPTCISDIESFCGAMFPGNENSFDSPQQQGQRRCQLFLEEMQRIYERINKPCPFPIKDNTPDLFIGDTKVFNQFGLLGSTSMKENQGIAINVCLHMDPSMATDKCCVASFCPTNEQIKFLDLTYWSFALYKMESMNREDICYPNYQVNAASICPVFNMYTAVSEASKNGIRVLPTGDTYKFTILINYNQETDDKMRTYIKNLASTQSTYQNSDFTYTMKIPNAKGSLPISDNLPNPNKLGESSKYFDPATDRFGFISRFVENETKREGYTSLSNFINDPENKSITVELWEFPEEDEYTPWDYQPFPKRLATPVNEVSIYNDEMTKLKTKLLKPLQEKFYTIKQLKTRYDLVNITAPLYSSILNGKNPYQGGFQAIQMAGNMQGDNPDAQYRLQEAACIDNNDVLISVVFNHQSVGNSYYNSLNITDGYQAYGYYGYNPGKKNRYIIFLTGRSPEALKMVEKNVQSLMEQFDSVDIVYKSIITDNTQLFAIPQCHPVLMIERIYLNTVYQSLEDPSKVYSVPDVIKRLTDGGDVSSDEIRSLCNVTGPALDNLIIPSYYKVNLNQSAVITTFVSMILFVFVVIVIAYYLRRWRLRKINKKK